MPISLWRLEQFTPRQLGKLRHEEAPKTIPDQQKGPFLVPDSWRKADSLTECDNDLKSSVDKRPSLHNCLQCSQISNYAHGLRPLSSCLTPSSGPLKTRPAPEALEHHWVCSPVPGREASRREGSHCEIRTNSHARQSGK